MTYQEALVCAGWRPTRRVNQSISHWRLRRYGYAVHPEALRFLTEFGGLDISLTPGVAEPALPSHVEIFSNFRRIKCPAKACLARPRDARFFADFFGWTVCYVGWVSNLLRWTCDEGAYLYSLSSGQFAISSADWGGVFLCGGTRQLWKFLLESDEKVVHDYILDDNEDANRLLAKMRLIVT